MHVFFGTPRTATLRVTHFLSRIELFRPALFSKFAEFIIMPAVVRIKRRIDEEPHTAFVLNGKRRRLHNDENSLEDSGAVAGASASDKDELTTVLKFAGTLEKQVRNVFPDPWTLEKPIETLTI